MKFIDKYSWKCMLGKMSRNIEENEIYAKWSVFGKKHIVLFRDLIEGDLEWIEKEVPFNFHYFSEEDIRLIKTKFKIKRSKLKSIYLNLNETLEIHGKKHRGIRNKINQCKKRNFEILSDYKDIKDIEKFIDIWSDNYSLKYFRDFSSKNLHFYKNNFHKDCINMFIYDNELIAYGSISPVVNKKSTYIIGKALYNLKDLSSYTGLSEFLDLSLYKKANEKGTIYVNLGASFSKNLLEYKSKFPGTYDFIEYEGKVDEI